MIPTLLPQATLVILRRGTFYSKCIPSGRLNELDVNPAEFENLANRTTLWKSQKRVGGKRNILIG